MPSLAAIRQLQASDPLTLRSHLFACLATEILRNGFAPGFY